MTFIALLRGINVGGKCSIKMADLKNMFETIGFQNIRTYVQSGNVVFDYEATDSSKLVENIEAKIIETFRMTVRVIIRSSNELRAIIDNNPYISQGGIDLEKLHVTFLSDYAEPDVSSSIEFKKEENEKYIIIDREIYLYCPNGYGNTKLNNAVFEKKLKIPATTRNWNTVNKLLELSK